MKISFQKIAASQVLSVTFLWFFCFFGLDCRAAPIRKYRRLASSQTRTIQPARRFTTAQYAALNAMLIGTIMTLSTPPPAEPHWRGGILFDDAVRDGLRMKTKSGRNTFSLTSDVLLFTSMSYPFLMDALIDSWISKGNGDRAGQLSLIAAQSFLLTGLIRTVAKVTVGRERPFQRECGGDPAYDDQCNDSSSRTSFFSGHSAFSFTAAGLICSAHEQYKLIGGSAPCYISLGVATVVSLSRVLSDKHYLTDTLAGAIIGLFSGYLVPKWINYSNSSRSGTQATIAPRVSNDGLGLNVAFIF